VQYRTLGRTGVQVSSLVLGAIVAPGTDLAPDEKHDTPPALLDPSLRRR
jgi:aryl-alcohol dehydrogenase-like predicted oxidoreductase